MRKWILIAFAVVGIFGCVFAVNNDNAAEKYLKINETVFTVELVKSAEDRARGLSDRDELKPRSGMLFVFPEVGRPIFWMKDMNFPLDIIWIDGDEIVEISKNVPVPIEGGEIPMVQPSILVDKVLEINSGEADKYGITKGNKIIFSK